MHCCLPGNLFTFDEVFNAILILVEKNRNYKIYVDIETRNMYITPNVYPNKSYTLMYDGEVPKIYTEDLNGQSYQDFLKNK